MLMAMTRSAEDSCVNEPDSDQGHRQDLKDCSAYPLPLVARSPPVGAKREKGDLQKDDSHAGILLKHRPIGQKC
jgi:hypothetical protein